MSSISSATFLSPNWKTAMAILTPVLAASMAIVSGISQAFQWGAAWSDMVITATRLEKERDRILVTPAEQIDAIKEMGMIDNLVLTETQGFFQRLFGGTHPANNSGSAPGGTAGSE